MKLLVPAAARLFTALENAIDAETEARRRIDSLAPATLLILMDAHGWHEIVVDPEARSLIEQVINADGSDVHLSDDDLDKLNDEAVGIVGQCPLCLFTFRDGQYRVSIGELETWLSQRQYVRRQ
ncbi:hypothetical protein nbrc107696_13110 [Gordonia spumicola]|uniref:Uncharacterized protein n=1 Tax=Gordonia spumicola TaxID=589161 RepID=A0A7I9V656_9ACTN|nr:hypothetical protein [Gordonia spumicola]GEE00865.1 hypothetical protein nbrc107696_13110 [Gordonia spumicola]